MDLGYVEDINIRTVQRTTLEFLEKMNSSWTAPASEGFWRWCNAPGYWVSGLCPSPNIPKEYSYFFEPGSVSILRWMGGKLACVKELHFCFTDGSNGIVEHIYFDILLHRWIWVRFFWLGSMVLFSTFVCHCFTSPYAFPQFLRYDASSRSFRTFYFTTVLLMTTKTKNIIFLHNHLAFQHISSQWKVFGNRSKSRYSDWLRAGRSRGRSSIPGRIKYLFSTASRLSPGPTQLPIQWSPGPFPQG
jgi:hypothetical protein